MKSFCAALLLCLALTHPAWAGGGSGVGNGGDSRTEQDFASYVIEVHGFLSDEAAKGHYDFVQERDFKKLNAALFSGASESIRYSSSPRLFLKRTSEGWHTPILEDEFKKLSSDPDTSNQVKEVDAINFPEMREIRVSVTRWSQKDSSSKASLALHEMLGLIESDLDYSISARFEAALRGSSSTAGLGLSSRARDGSLPQGFNGVISFVQVQIQNSLGGLDTSGAKTWLNWNSYRAMESGAPDSSSLALLARYFVQFSFTKSDDHHAHASIQFSSVDPDFQAQAGFSFSLGDEMDGEKLALSEDSKERFYYFKGAIKPMESLFSSPFGRKAGQNPFQRTDYYYNLANNTLLRIWLTCSTRDETGCSLFRFNSAVGASSPVKVSINAALYSIQP